MFNRICRLASASLLAFIFIFSHAFADISVEETKVTASDGHPNNFFGWRVAIDGDIAAVGAYRDSPDFGDFRNAGAVYVYERNTAAAACQPTGTIDAWCETAKLVGFDATPGEVRPYRNERLGSDVAVSGDTVIGGASRDVINGLFNAGSAYVYTKVAGAWANQQKLVPSDPQGNAFFGNAMTLDGDKAYIGAGGADGSGAVYEFTRSAGTWTETAKIVPDTRVPGQNFGATVALHGDTLLVAAGWENTENGEQAGAAYVFTRQGGNWAQQARLQPLDPDPQGRFGVGVTVYGDTALIGAPYDSDIVTGAGAAYVFTRSGSTWTEQVKIPGPGGGVNEFFGFVLVLSGNIAAIPSDLEDDGLLVDVGAAYIYTGAGANWTQQVRIVPSDALGSDVLGWGTALDGTTAIFGAPTSTFNWQGRPGAAYIYELGLGVTETGSDVEVTPEVLDENGEPAEDVPAMELSFDTVTESGETTVTVTEGGPPPPSGFEIGGVQGQAVYLDIETTATFEGPVEICIDYSTMDVSNPEKLAFLHYEDPDGDGVGEWVDITTVNDIPNTTLCGESFSFSFFALVEVLPFDELVQAMLDAIAALPPGSGDIDFVSRLTAQFQQALGSLDNADATEGEEHIAEAAAELGEFKDEVVELRDEGLISADDADVLLSLADLIIDSLGDA